MSDDEGEQNAGPKLSRAEVLAMKREQAKQELQEYEEARREEKEKADQEIQELRERREKRKKEREEEDRRLAEQRVVEEQRKRQEDEERQRKKREEEANRRQDRERKQEERESQMKQSNKRNFVISKKGGDDEAQVEKGPEVEAKSKEQLEAEKRAILAQRIHPLEISGMSGDQLKGKAKELYDQIYRLECDKYDLEQTFQQQALDLSDLAEKARQMNKGGKGKSNQSVAPDPLAAIISGIPPKVTMYSEYERVKDRRSFGDRKNLYVGQNYVDLYTRVEPTQKVALGEAGFFVEGEWTGAPPTKAAPKEAPAPAAAPPPPEETEAEVTLEAED